MWYYSKPLGKYFWIWIVVLEGQTESWLGHIQQNTHSISDVLLEEQSFRTLNSRERAWRDVSTVKSARYSSRGTEFQFIPCICSSKSYDPLFWVLWAPALTTADTYTDIYLYLRVKKFSKITYRLRSHPKRSVKPRQSMSLGELHIGRVDGSIMWTWSKDKPHTHFPSSHPYSS